MRIRFDNVDPNSHSGPNSFGRKLIGGLRRLGHDVSTNLYDCDVQLSFIQTVNKAAPKTALRLDGIYFNTKQKWEDMNRPILESYQAADSVVFQTYFNKSLSEKYFGVHANSIVINNGTDFEEISKIAPVSHPRLDKYEELWCCSSSWRPHKRLKANIEYYFSNRPKGTGLVILGENPDHVVDHPDVMYAGRQSWETCISIYKRCKKFIHLAFLDHCPNVVVDARASGCELVVASSGGTREVAGPATVIHDIEWDLRPLDLYSPPQLDYSKSFTNDVESSIDINAIATRYAEHLGKLIQ